MSTQGIQTALIKFAKSDLRIAKKNGLVAIAQTKVGNVEIECDGTNFQASNFNNTNIKLTGKMSFENMVTWLADKYQVV